MSRSIWSKSKLKQVNKSLKTNYIKDLCVFIFDIFKSGQTQGLLLNYQQTASYRRNKNQTAKHWVNRRGGGVDENLTYDNKKFLDQVVIDKYSQDSPLKLAPWKRGQFNKDSVYV